MRKLFCSLPIAAVLTMSSVVALNIVALSIQTPAVCAETWFLFQAALFTAALSIGILAARRFSARSTAKTLNTGMLSARQQFAFSRKSKPDQPKQSRHLSVAPKSGLLSGPNSPAGLVCGVEPKGKFHKSARQFS